MGSLTNVMGALSPFLNVSGIPGGIISTAAFAAKRFEDGGQFRSQQDLALQQLQQRQKLEEGQSYEKALLEKQKMDADAAANAERRKAALRRAVARQKTLFSAQGLSPADSGSSEAVLLGMVDDTQLDQDAEDRLTGLRTAALDQSLNAQRQKNLLEAAQMDQAQGLARILRGY